jgi:hypothetical protein
MLGTPGWRTASVALRFVAKNKLQASQSMAKTDASFRS